jgi:hypothetical protein
MIPWGGEGGEKTTLLCLLMYDIIMSLILKFSVYLYTHDAVNSYLFSTLLKGVGALMLS